MKEYAEDLKKANEILRAGGVILYPTDTIWGLGCDATNPDAIKKIFSIKKRSESKSMIILLDNESRLLSYVKEIPEQAWMMMEHAENPLTIIYDGAKNLPAELIADDGSIAIRITRDSFCRDLVFALRKPVVSTSANVSGDKSPGAFSEIDESIINSVDYVVGYRKNDNTGNKASAIMRIKTNGEIQFIRR
jgi:L-threonylcarbamoyladenylate synthase